MNESSASSENIIKPSESITAVKYDSKYDILKFILSLMVLAIHTVLFPMALYPWLRIAVPLFFIMSSKFVFSKLNKASPDQHAKILRGFVLRNLQLYICWFIILIPITLYVRSSLYFSGNILQNILNIVRSILFSSSFIASWFIMATIIGVLLIYFLSRVLRKNYLIFIFALFAFIFVTLASSYEYVIADTFISSAIEGYITIFSELVCSFPAAIFWVFIGKLFAEQKIKIKSTVLWAILTVLSCAALYIEWRCILHLDGSYSNDSYFMLAPVCILLFIGVEKLKPIYWKPSMHLKRMSTIIYVSHASLIPIVARVIMLIFHSSSPLLSFTITLIGCITIYFCIEFAIKLFQKYRFKKILKMLY